MAKTINTEAAVKRYTDAMASGATKQKYIDGINSVTESPMAKAASPAAMDLYLRRTQESVTSGKRARNLLAAPLSRYKDNATKKGADRLASGAATAVDKVRAHFQKWGPTYQQVSDTVASMPKGTREDAKNRSNKAIDMLMDAAGRS